MNSIPQYIYLVSIIVIIPIFIDEGTEKVGTQKISTLPHSPAGKGWNEVLRLSGEAPEAGSTVRRYVYIKNFFINLENTEKI